MRRKTLTRTCLTIVAFLAASFADSTKSGSPPNEIKSVRANGVTLHYIERGSGPAVVFVHGSIEDYRAWEAQMEPLAQHFHVIAYSRRYNFPNHNSLRSDGHSAVVEAEDLAALIRKLKLGSAHVVGHSYGAYAALILADRHPDLDKQCRAVLLPSHRDRIAVASNGCIFCEK